MHPLSPCSALPLVVETGSRPTVTLIVLHGLGTSGEAFRPVAETIATQMAEPVRFILPTASPRPISLYSGQVASAWFDLLDTNFIAREDEPGLKMAADYVDGLIDAEIARGIAPARIVLGGFSQGGALSLLTGLRSAHRLGGIIALSGWLPLADGLASERSAKAHDKPVFLGHGKLDQITPVDMAETARDRLTDWGCRVDLRTYSIGHTIDRTELRDVGDWLARELS